MEYGGVSAVAALRWREAAAGVQSVATLLEAATPKPFNSALLICSQRGVLYHRKVHICDFDAPEFACDRGHEFQQVGCESVCAWTGSFPRRQGRFHEPALKSL